MRKASVIYKGQSDKIGRFGTVETGSELLLLESEYRCVAEDPRYEFQTWVEVSQRGEVTVITPDPEPEKEQETKEEEQEEGQEEEEEDSDEESLDDMTVAELKELISSINQELPDDEQLPSMGKKADLIDRIEAYQAQKQALAE